MSRDLHNTVKWFADIEFDRLIDADNCFTKNENQAECFKTALENTEKYLFSRYPPEYDETIRVVMNELAFENRLHITWNGNGPIQGNGYQFRGRPRSSRGPRGSQGDQGDIGDLGIQGDKIDLK